LLGVLFISRGRTLRFHDLFREELRSILRRYTSSGFTGRLVINSGRFVVEVDLLRGRVVAALARDEERGTIYQGVDAIRLLGSVADKRSGFVEVVELDERRVSVDLESFPSARLGAESEKILEPLLGGGEVAGGESVAAPAPPERVETRGLGAERVSEKLREALRDVGTLVKIVLDSYRSSEEEFSGIDGVKEALRKDMGPGSIGYARCHDVEDSSKVIHVLCSRDACATSGSLDGESRRLRCKLYWAPSSAVPGL